MNLNDCHAAAHRVSFEAEALTISIFILAIVAAILDANFFSVNFIASESLGRAERDTYWVSRGPSVVASANHF